MRRLRLWLAVFLAVLIVAPAAGAAIVSYPGDGWFPPHATFEWQHPDQGRDIVTDWKGIVQAPGAGCVVGIGQDQAFPNGFGPDFPLVRIDTGPFASPQPWYLGHTSTLVRDGQCFPFGTPLSRADQGRPSWIGYVMRIDGGWVEIGQQEPNGILGPYSSTGHWYDDLLRQTLQVGTDPLAIFPDTEWSSPFGPVSERDLILHYIGARKHPVKYRNFLKHVIEPRLQFTAGRIAWLATHVWGTLRHPKWLNDGGPRFQFEIKASAGRLVRL